MSYLSMFRESPMSLSENSFTFVKIVPRLFDCCVDLIDDGDIFTFLHRFLDCVKRGLDLAEFELSPGCCGQPNRTLVFWRKLLRLTSSVEGLKPIPYCRLKARDVQHSSARIRSS